MLIGQQPGKKHRQGHKNKRILGRDKAQSAVVTQPQGMQDENASLIKGNKLHVNTDKNYELMYDVRISDKKV